MQRFIWTCLLLFFFCVLSAQHCSTRSEWWSDKEQYIPKEDTPFFELKVNYVIPQRADGTGNFSEDDPEHEALLEDYLSFSNWLWKKLKDPKDETCYPGDDFVPSTYIRFKLNAIIYVQDDYLWNAENGSACPNDRNWYLNGLEKEIQENPDHADAINIYLPNDSSSYFAMIIDQTSFDDPKDKPPCSELPSKKDLNRSSRINLSGAYNKYWFMKHRVPTDTVLNPKGHSWEGELIGWERSSRGHTIAHELGHSMGLQHSNEYHGRNRCHFSIMSQRHGSPHNYLQPSEIGKMHRNLRLTNIRDFLTHDVYVSNPMVIEGDHVMDMDFKSYEDFIIASGATLEVSCPISFPQQASLIIQPGGRLVIGEGTVSGRNTSEEWMGVVVQQYRKPFWKRRKPSEKGIIETTGEGRILGKVSKQRLRKSAKRRN